MDANDKIGQESLSGDKDSNQDATSGDKDQQLSPGDEEALKRLQKFAEEFANKKHSKLDTRINTLTGENEDLRKQVGGLQGKLSDLDKGKLEADEKAELDKAGDDSERRKQVSDRYSLVREVRGLTAKKQELNDQIVELTDVLERWQTENRDRKLQELCKGNTVLEELIKPLLAKIEEPKALEELVKTIAEKLPKGEGGLPGNPPPDSLRTTPVASLKGKTPDELAEEAYAKARK